MRTLEQFSSAFRSLKWFVSFHNKPVWLVPTENEYKLSVVKPKPDELPEGTCANLYFHNGEILDSVDARD